MGTALVKIKIMPKSPDVNLDELETKAKKICEEQNGKNPRIEKEPIAFGLTALILQFAIDESNEIDPVEDSLKELSEISSTEVIDFRRAFG